MRRLVLVMLITLGAHAHAKESPLEYMDILGPEVVGEIGSRPYDVSETVARNDHRYVGTTAIGGGMTYAGGLGVRLVLRFDPRQSPTTPATHGLHVSFEGSVGFGRLIGADGPFTDYASVTRGEFLTGLGYEFSLGRRVVLHTATMVGVSIQSMDAAGLRATQTALAVIAPADGTPPPGFSLEAIDLRLGQQVGIHVQLAKWLAVFGDGTVDYDGQWRVRAGFALGAPRAATF